MPVRPPRQPLKGVMFEANCLEEKPASIVSRVKQSREPCLVTARPPRERGVLIALDDEYEGLLALHAQVINALMKDLQKAGTDMAMYCLQVGYSNERDAIRFLDARGRPVLAMVGVRKFLRWQEKRAAAPAAKRSAAKTPLRRDGGATGTPRKPRPAARKTGSGKAPAHPVRRKSSTRPRTRP